MNNEPISIKKGGTKPHIHLLPMMALLVFGMIALVGVVSADDYYKGFAPVTDYNGTVTGDVNVMFNDTWRSSTDPNMRDVWANFTLPQEAVGNITWAKLIVVVYSGNMTANYVGEETITLNNVYLAGSEDEGKRLDLEYYRTVGANRTYPGDYFIELNRVTSDYDNQFNVTDLLQSGSQVNVHVVTNNISENFDGRIKEVKLKYAYNDSNSNSSIKYWVNEGHDPITKENINYVDNVTYFNTGTLSSVNSAKLYVDYLGTASGKGTYTWNGQNLNVSDADYVQEGGYGGLICWNMTNKTFTTNNNLAYDRTNNWYKIIQAVLVVEPNET